MSKHPVDDLVFFSGGASSWACAKRLAEREETTRLRLLFTDTLIEDDSLYKFLHVAAANCGGELICIADGRTPWEVFRDERMLGNSRVDPCSKILKRNLSKKWVHTNYPDPSRVRLWIGMNWDEEHRLKRSQKYWEPYTMDSTLCHAPWISQPQILEWIKEEGMELPRLYELGFSHNNCGGGCIKAGHSHFRHLLKTLPDVFEEWENEEEKMRQFLDRDVSILKDRRGGETKTLTLKQLRVMTDDECPEFEWGGCGCFAVESEDDNEQA